MNPQKMLATDLDGTFIGDEQAMEQLWREMDDAGILVVFSTGRHLASIEGFYREVGTSRRAAACVAMVGTEIWHLQDDGYECDESWRRRIAVSWDKGRVEAAMTDVADIVSQPGEWQSAFKASYYLESAADSQIAEIRANLAAAGLDVKIVYSSGRFLDLLPSRAGKGAAVRHLADTLSIRPENIVTAGDTGNDLDMMRPELGLRSIVVGNASAELLTSAPAGAYRAEATFAAGIREGLEHYGWLESAR